MSTNTPYDPLDDLLSVVPELRKASRGCRGDTASDVNGRLKDVLGPVIHRIQQNAIETRLMSSGPTFKAKTALASFLSYCVTNPQMRFWQALRNWCGWPFVLVSKDLPPDARMFSSNYRDTFYWEDKGRRVDD